MRLYCQKVSIVVSYSGLSPKVKPRSDMMLEAIFEAIGELFVTLIGWGILIGLVIAGAGVGIFFLVRHFCF